MNLNVKDNTMDMTTAVSCSVLPSKLQETVHHCHFVEYVLNKHDNSMKRSTGFSQCRYSYTFRDNIAVLVKSVSIAELLFVMALASTCLL
jgi:hypothetical protein